MEKRSFSTAVLDAPARVSKEWGVNKYSEERKAIKEDLKGMNVYNFEGDPTVRKTLQAIAKKVINTTVDQVPLYDLSGIILPRVDGEVGTTIEQHEIEGLRIYEGTYGAAVRMSAIQIKPYTVTTNLKEIGIRIVLADLQSGKYSTSEVGEYAAQLIGAYRNRLIFRTLEANASLTTSGSNYMAAGGPLGAATMLMSLGTISDEAEIKVILGRRRAVARLSANAGYSNDTRREFEKTGQIGTYAGVPVLQVNSWTDPTYGSVAPFAKDELWLFSTLPCGRFMVVKDVDASTELVARNGVMNIYYRWDDGAAIWKPSRAFRIDGIT